MQRISKNLSKSHRNWQNISNQRRFMDSIAKKLNITDMEGWYKVTRKILQKNGAGSLVCKYGSSPRKLLEAVYPEYLRMLDVDSFS